MSVTTFEATVDQGQIKLKNGIRLPDNIKVYVIVPDLQISSRPKLFSPRLAHKMTFLNRRFRGQFLLTDSEFGFLGRNVLNSVRLLFDGPQLNWDEYKG